MAKTRKVRHAFAGSSRMIRLRIDEGITPHPDERRLIQRDRNGNKLIDVVNPRTGFYVGVRSPLWSAPAKPGEGVSGAGKPLPEKGNDGLYVDEGKVVRTVDMGDTALPNRRTIVDRSADDTTPSNSAKLSRAAQGCVDVEKKRRRSTAPRVTRKLCEEYIRIKGFHGLITDEMIELARACIKANRKKK